MQPEQPQGGSILDVRVYYEDTDAGGVVYYANYLKYFERARSEWLRGLGISQSTLAREQQRLFVVRGLEIQYRKPAQLDDVLQIHSRIARLGRVSLVFAQQALRGNERLCEAQVEVCCVKAGSLRPVAFTPDIQSLLEKARD